MDQTPRQRVLCGKYWSHIKEGDVEDWLDVTSVDNLFYLLHRYVNRGDSHWARISSAIKRRIENK